MKNFFLFSILFFTNSFAFNLMTKKGFLSSTLIQNKESIRLNCLYGFKHQSITGISTPIRLNKDYEIECLSLNGIDCTWDKILTPQDCYKFTKENVSKIKPLVCGTMHKEVHGTIGYGDPNHWCEVGKKFFFDKWHCAEETGIETGIKIDFETKNVECLSRKGHSCVWDDDSACPSANTCTKHCEYKKSVKCGSASSKFFNGLNLYYDEMSNWCKRANKYFFGESDWQCGGDNFKIDIPFRYNENGDIECFSLNGRDCAWGKGTGEQCLDYIRQNITKVKPLICGEMHKDFYNDNGYANKDHWCRKLMDGFVLSGREK